MPLKINLQLNSSVPDGAYICLNAGNGIRKLKRYDPNHHFEVPASQKFYRIEVLQQIGHCDICVDPTIAEERTCNLLGQNALMSGATLKWESHPTEIGPSDSAKSSFEKDVLNASTLSVELKEYFETSNVASILKGAVTALLRDRPKDARQFLLDYIGCLSCKPLVPTQEHVVEVVVDEVEHKHAPPAEEEAPALLVERKLEPVPLEESACAVEQEGPPLEKGNLELVDDVEHKQGVPADVEGPLAPEEKTPQRKEEKPEQSNELEHKHASRAEQDDLPPPVEEQPDLLALDELAREGEKDGHPLEEESQEQVSLRSEKSFAKIAPITSMFVINGFYMAMRDCYTREGAKIHFFELEWNPNSEGTNISWKEFRLNVLGATDPKVAASGSLRHAVKENWKELGLLAEPFVRDNGLHGSASPFEGMVERANWLGINIEEDEFGKALAAAGVPFHVQRSWMGDPQVDWEGEMRSLFDLLEDLDAEECLVKAAKVLGIDEVSDAAKSLCNMNKAFVFVKPHAMVSTAVVKVASGKFLDLGFTIVSQGVLVNTEIKEKKLVDKHYGAIANRAALLKPSEMNLSSEAAKAFANQYGGSWDDAVKKNIVFNAVDACEYLGIDGDTMQLAWNKGKDDGHLVKFGGGFYCNVIDCEYVSRLTAPSPEDPNVYIVNGFYMAMRDNYVREGAAIYYFDVEWHSEATSWMDFRQKILGATDPEKSLPDSLRGMIREQWESLGLPSPVTVQNNGVHGSASPLEALVERCNWLDDVCKSDEFASVLESAGVPLETQRQWFEDPQVSWEGKDTSLFDLFEDTDTWPLVVKAAKLMGLEEPTESVKANCKKNRAFVFIKPHAIVASKSVHALVRQKFADEGFKILREGLIERDQIDQKGLIDRHYGAIATKAKLLSPKETRPSEKALALFEATFGLPWGTALDRGKVLNAMEACRMLGVDSQGLLSCWNHAKSNNLMIKFGGGFYVARVAPDLANVSITEDMSTSLEPSKPIASEPSQLTSDQDIFIINGFYLTMRECYTRPGAAIHYFDVEFDGGRTSWRDFRQRVLGATDPETAGPNSLRGMIRDDWESLGLFEPPSVRDNGFHGSASPLEGMVERCNWLDDDLEDDPYALALLAAGVPFATQREWLSDPQVKYDHNEGSLFDLCEDLDSWDLLVKAAKVMGRDELSDDVKDTCPKNRALVFVKPHANIDSVHSFVRGKFENEGFKIIREGSIGSDVIEEKRLIDRHYGAIAAKAVDLSPKDTSPSVQAMALFQAKFGISWDDALASGRVLNAAEACKQLGIDGDALQRLWNGAKNKDALIKFGGGFYCARVSKTQVTMTKTKLSRFRVQ